MLANNAVVRQFSLQNNWLLKLRETCAIHSSLHSRSERPILYFTKRIKCPYLFSTCNAPKSKLTFWKTNRKCYIL